ncbi:hypothetical protein [Microbacterium sp. E-13]|uniref:hypothetical protein n=1 Tax=Microbacterium sp. E-13 TaxID=3404048 RepID=UPI003CF7F78B
MAQRDSLGKREQARRPGTVYATIAVAVIQVVATIVVSLMFTVDMFSLGACTGCPDQAQKTAQLIFFVPTLAMIALTIGAMVLGYAKNRSLSWVPLVASAGTLVAYVVARNYIYGVI